MAARDAWIGLGKFESLSQKYYAGKKALIVANSKEFGEVMAVALMKKGIKARYVLASSLTRPSATLSRRERGMRSADIVITACGIPGLINGEMIKKGATIIDGGITKRGKKVLGDADMKSIRNIAGFATPVPGGVGPVTVATLMENVYQLAGKQSG